MRTMTFGLERVSFRLGLFASLHSAELAYHACIHEMHIRDPVAGFPISKRSSGDIKHLGGHRVFAHLAIMLTS